MPAAARTAWWRRSAGSGLTVLSIGGRSPVCLFALRETPLVAQPPPSRNGAREEESHLQAKSSPTRTPPVKPSKAPTSEKEIAPVKPTRAAQKLAAKLKAAEAAKKKRQERARQSLARWRKQALKAPLPRRRPAPPISRENDEARRACIERMRAETEASRLMPRPLREQSFEALKSEWAKAILYVHRFGERDPHAPDIVTHRIRITEIEAEWRRRAGLARNDPGYFKWPSTEAHGGSRDLNGNGWQDTGILGYLGYRVGRGSDLSKRERELLLSHIFSMQLPPLNDPTYMRQWSLPDSPQRLRKMAECIAAFARNAKRRRTQNFAEAARHWEEDLSFLRRDYYVGKFRFAFDWPVV